MYRRLVHLALVVVVCGLGTARAQDWYRAAYWDPAYRTNWVSEENSVVLRDGLSAKGYQILNAAQLKSWMTARIADGAPSVVVFCRDNAPDTVVEAVNATCLLRRYLNAGGKIVWPADIPFYDIASAGTSTNYSATGSTAILGFYAANGTWDGGSTVTITAAGTKWGLSKTWASVRPAQAASVDIVLATDSAGAAAAWVKHYLPKDTFRGFVRILDASGLPDVEDVVRLAEYREPFPYAMLISPANGSLIQPVEYTLKWRAGDYATSHNVYFSNDLEALNAGRVAPVSTTETSLLVKDLVPGTTYYWRVDEVAEGNPSSPWKGEISQFTVQPLTAWNPTPADGSQYIRTDSKLTWSNGRGVIFHTIYFDTSLEAVTNGTAPSMMVADPVFTPDGTLQPGVTYYWRVDEFTGMTTNKGNIWSFTTIPAIPVTDSHLMGWWKLDEGAGTVAVDWSGRGNHGTIVGDPTWVDGFYGPALLFSAGKYINCGVDAGASINGDFTLASWVQLSPGNAGLYGGIGGRLVLATNYYGFSLVRHSSNVFRLWVGDGTASLSGIASSDSTYTDTEWHHIAGVRQGQANILFVDGVRQGASNTTNFSPSAEWFHIGRQYSHLDDRYFPGVIDDVRVYDVASDDAKIAQIMAGDPVLAAQPQPANGLVVDIRNVSDLAWTAGQGAVSHDVYFGTSRSAVANADRSSPEFAGNQADTGLALPGLVAFGGGPYAWRVDEVEADGTTHKGYVWTFTVPACLIVDDFESYTDDEGSRIYEAWEDGLTNKNSTSVVGYAQAPFAEQKIVNGGRQSMPMDYDNTASPYFAEAEMALDGAQNWTEEGVAVLSLAVRGNLDNGAGTLYVGLQDSTGKLVYVSNPDASILTSAAWTTWKVPLSQFGVKATAIKKIVVGVGNHTAPAAGGKGRIYIDDICLVRP